MSSTKLCYMHNPSFSRDCYQRIVNHELKASLGKSVPQKQKQSQGKREPSWAVHGLNHEAHHCVIEKIGLLELLKEGKRNKDGGREGGKRGERGAKGGKEQRREKERGREGGRVYSSSQFQVVVHYWEGSMEAEPWSSWSHHLQSRAARNECTHSTQLMVSALSRPGVKLRMVLAWIFSPQSHKQLNRSTGKVNSISIP